jgi:PAS domain S-box-containing protein
MMQAKIIVAEDERIVALHLKQQLQKLGYEVVAVVASGANALQKISELRPQVILMDIHIEGAIDGIETASKIPAEFEIPVIYVTAYSEETTLERARTTKPYGYLIKPFSERELHATIQMALERRRADSALQASEDRFRSIFGAISEGIFILDAATGIFIDVNGPGALMFGYTPDELVGRDIQALSFSDEAPYTQREAADWIDKTASGHMQRFDWQGKTKDGRMFPAEVSMRTATIGGRDVMLSVVRDLTERQALEEQLRQSQKLKAVGQLTGGIAHDFNNILTVILGNADALAELLEDENFRRLAVMTRTAAERGAELTNRLLAFARRQALQPKLVDVNRLITEMDGLLCRTLGENIEIAFQYSENLWTALVDPGQLENAILNLCLNARDAISGGGQLTIETANIVLDETYAESADEVTAGEYVMIAVSDSGSGMSPETVAKAFDPFFTTKDIGHGTGLGLSMVYGFLKQSHGHAKIYSELEHGTTIKLYLPRSLGAGEKRAVSKHKVLVQSGTEAILVVEDNDLVRTHATMLLESLGYKVIAACNGREALRILERGDAHFDLLFTDVVMPGGINGRQLAELVAKLRPDLPVLFTSGYTENAIVHHGRLDQGIQLLNKPYRRDALAAKVRLVLDTVVRPQPYSTLP